MLYVHFLSVQIVFYALLLLSRVVDNVCFNIETYVSRKMLKIYC